MGVCTIFLRRKTWTASSLKEVRTQLEGAETNNKPRCYVMSVLYVHGFYRPADAVERTIIGHESLAPCFIVEVYRRFRDAYCLHLKGDEKIPSQNLRYYTAQNLRCQSSSYLPPWEPEIWYDMNFCQIICRSIPEDSNLGDVVTE
jgi:hypothetical protein